MSASTAYWLQVGTKRHVAGRSGDTICRYSWIREISPRTAILAAVPMNARGRVVAFTACFPAPARVVSTGAVPARVGPRTPCGYRVARGSPIDRIGRARPAGCGLRAAGGERPCDVRRRIPRACPQPIRRAAGGLRRGRVPDESARRHRAVPCESRASPSRQSQLSASCGCVREAPPKDLTSDQAESARRPLRRRPDTIARPARVRIRKRKPCTRARRRLFGWKVRLPLATTFSSLCCHPAAQTFRIGLVRGSTGGGLGAAGRRGPQVVRVAAVSPTFGRLFEGTDEASPGQTWPAATKPRGRVEKIFCFAHTRRGRRYHNDPKQAPRTLNDPIGMQRNGWQPNGKLLASAKSI